MAYNPAFHAGISLQVTHSVGVVAEELLERCAEGDELAWQRLYDSYHTAARGFLYRLGVRGDALDDTCQEVFLEAFRYLPRFRGECSFKTWLYRLCATQARKVRTRQRINEALLALLPWEVSRTLGDGEGLQPHAESLIQAGLAVLTQKERLIFVLYELEGVSGKEIAEIVASPEASIWRVLHYARKKFCARVEGGGGKDETISRQS